MYLTGTKSKFSSLMAINNPKMLLPPLALTSLLILVSAALLGAINGHDFEIKEATVEGIGRAFAEGKLSSSQLVESYLRRIEALNPLLRAVVEVNPDAVDQAAAADRERESRSPASPPLSPLHGVPVLLKDTIATKDKLNTTAGSYVLLGSVVPRDAGVVERLREAGAVILGKASLSEWYRFRSLENVPNGWCARSGQGVNPYVESGDPCGSSSGPAIAVAANLVLVSVGTETHCSIICPADHNSVVGLKPTVGLTSRAGVIPMLPLLDSVGPICRTVSDAVHVLDVIVGVDPRDEATMEASKFIPAGGYNQFLNPYGLRGKRLGVFRNPFSNGSTSTVISMFEHHLDALRQGGAVIVDNLEIANIHIILNPGQSGELTLMKAGFKLSINDYLKELITSPVRSLAEIIAFIENNPHLEKTKEIGQDMFIAAEKTNGFGEKERRAAKRIEQLSMDGFEKMMSENNLDAMVTLGSDSIAVMAIGGYPAITVPAGYDTNGMPFGICFGGLKGSEPRLIEIAYGFEKATMVRKPPFSRSMEFINELHPQAYHGIVE